jgi:hypothetical protein
VIVFGETESIMLEAVSSTTAEKLRVFRKEKVVNGERTSLQCVEIKGQIYCSGRGFVSVASLEDEWYEDVNDPESVIVALTDCEVRPDIFTFWQRVPETEPKYGYPMEWESLAVLPISTYDHWWIKQVKGTTRNMIRKSQKSGVDVREAVFDDEFVRGMVDIFNECPVRQGRPFWHYGKDVETVKREFSRFLFREYLIGAYLGSELIGLVMLADAGRYGILGQFISKLRHRDKATNNALIAKTVEVCVERQLPYLNYTDWRDTTLVDFKRYNGFREMRVPRYFVPLTAKGRLALQLGLHHGWRAIMPPPIRNSLKKLRKSWYQLRTRVKPVSNSSLLPG